MLLPDGDPDRKTGQRPKRVDCDDTLSALYSMDPEVEVVILAPSDDRSADFRFSSPRPDEIRDLWRSLCPDRPEESLSFFKRAVERLANTLRDSVDETTRNSRDPRTV